MLLRDIPPTAGMSTRLRDFLPRPGNFTQRLSEQLEIPKPILCCSGTAALVVSLMVLKELLPERDTVIVPAYSCPLVILAIAHCGLKAQLCDTEQSHFDFDFSKLKMLVNEKTVAVVPTHLGGRLADVAAAKAIAQPAGAYVIEDAAWATGARQAGQSVGLAGDIGFFSLAVGKGLTTFEGGILFSSSVTLHTRLADVAKKLLPDDWRWELRRTIELISYAIFYQPERLRYVYGKRYRKAVKNNDWLTALGDRFSKSIPMHSLGAWRQNVAANALSRLQSFHAQTRAQAKWRTLQLKQIPNLQILDDVIGNEGIWPFIMVLFPDEALRDTALERLTLLGLGVSRLFTYALNEYDYLKPYIISDAMPAASDFACRLLTISNSSWLSNHEFGIIISHIKNVLSHT